MRQQVIAHLEREEGVEPGTFADAVPRTVVTTGSQQLLYLVAEALLDPGDIVLVESPTYFVFIGLLEGRGARPIGVATDEGGMSLEALEAALAGLDARGELERVKLIYTVSEHSNPSGLSLAAERRGVKRRMLSASLTFLPRIRSATRRVFCGVTRSIWRCALAGITCGSPRECGRCASAKTRPACAPPCSR